MAGLPREDPKAQSRPRSDVPFFAALGILGGVYVALIVAMLVADAAFTTPDHLWQALGSAEIQYAIKLSLISCSITAILSLWVAVPLGYLLSRFTFPGKGLVDAIVDIPIVLPPLVVGLSLLILFQTWPGRQVERVFPITYEVPSVILAQFAVACAFAVRTMRVTFDQIPPRREQVALTLGCSRSQAFWRVVLPEARRGVITAATLAWARALGEFGPVLVFSGATRMRTEVLPTTVFLELSVGRLEAAVAVSLLMVLAAMVVLVIVRVYGMAGEGTL
jgi:molybdate transport system permease protein